MTVQEAPQDEGTPPPEPSQDERPPQDQDGQQAQEGRSAKNTDDDFDEDALGQTANVINNFFAEVSAQKATFGITGGPAVRSVSGRLDRGDVERALARFVRPRGFDRALTALRERHVVVLVGDEGIGKWTSGVALLAEAGLSPERITVFSPGLDLDGLLAVSFKKDRVYLVHDWIEGKVENNVRRFGLDTLSTRLTRAGAHLVITLNRAETRQGFEAFEIGWEPPNPLEVLGARLGRARLSHDEAGLPEEVATLRSPRQVVELAEQMLSGSQSPQEIMADLCGGTVTTWFDTRPKRSEVLAVAALAFVYGLPERVFERLLVRLTTIADEVERQGAERERRSVGENLPQSRRLWNDGNPLIGLSADAGEPRVVFRSPHHREQVILQLYRVYGYGVLEPLRQWVRELADDLPEVQVQVAAGLALLARKRPEEVRESFLIPWAGGLVQERMAAASTLSMMCADDTTAAVAFTTALSWVENAGQPQAMTAALAFAGGLSIRYPAETVDWLWYLSLRGVRVSNVAQRALTLMFQTAAERDDEALTGLRLLVRHLDRDLSEGMEPQRARRALQAVLGVLAADRLEREESLMAWLLLSQPASAKAIGTLWAWTLYNAHHRSDAVRALCRTLRHLGEQAGATGATAAAEALGVAVWSALPEAAAVLVRRAINHACAGGHVRRDSPPAKHVVLALLNAGSRQIPS
ncbi:hypothetical protein [Streptosporangium carneum]|uniref:Uncharacterized protein n=1 Tax=Streptosporangium carneum TaxID=47481 RepID=A0A9W6MA64_9ACTN|nr:hypothetical protein [Streptosporangium carneum]GLK06716.1 hypothetical protein GCM10017600_01210 [Streptosporangium carneum]